MVRLRTKTSAFLWTFVLYLLGVILFGAWVRITHSGAGCGSHWPTCHGQIIPIDPSIETIIEFTHRLTSGALGILGIFFFAIIFKRCRWTSASKAAVVTLVLIVFEALIGAGIVLKELVASDDSVARAIVIAIHLVNTLFLTASATFAAYKMTLFEKETSATDRKWFWLSVVLLIGLILSSMSGAVTALGDTLFPIASTPGESIFDHVANDLDATNHFLVRLRIVHPVVASIVAIFCVIMASIMALSTSNDRVALLARIVSALAVIQLLAGFTNIALAAPGWMQLVHLLLAQLLWMAAFLMTYELSR